MISYTVFVVYNVNETGIFCPFQRRVQDVKYLRNELQYVHNPLM